MNPNQPQLQGQSSSGIPKYNTNYNYNSPTPGGTTTTNGYTSPNFGNFNTGQNQNLQNFTQGQAGQVSGFQNAYNAAAQAMPTYQALNQASNAQYNVEPLMQNATNLNNQVLRLPSENFGMTQGSDTNQGQLDQMTGVQQFRLQPLAQNATAQAQQAQTLSNQNTGYGIQNEAQMLSPYANTVPLLQSQMQTAGAAFTQQQQNELSALQAAVQSGTTLTADQQDNLNKLQVAQQGYINNLQVQAMQNAGNLANTIQGQKYLNIPAGNNVVNTVAQGYVNPGSGKVGSY